MTAQPLNPWTFAEGMDQGLLVPSLRDLVIVSGQCSVSPEGHSLYPGDMRAQTLAAIDNVETVLAEAGMDLANIIRMNTYVTDMRAFLEDAAEPLAERLARHGVRPPGVLAGIVCLARPELLVEIEVFAAR